MARLRHFAKLDDGNDNRERMANDIVDRPGIGHTTRMAQDTFSVRLERWLKNKDKKTVQTLLDAFEDKSFAILLLMAMALPALPIPTGGVTHVLEIIVMLLALELIAGREEVWLPASWRRTSLNKSYQSSAVSKLSKVVRFAEKFSSPRMSRLIASRTALRVYGLIVLILTIFAFIAPPFSGLDTLPSLGVVLISLGIILEDTLIGLAGIIVGAVGIGLIIALGGFVLKLF